MTPLAFLKSSSFTLGVELELQILDPLTLDLTPKAPALLAGAPSSLTGRFKPEFIQSMVEINTTPCASVQEVEEELTVLCRAAEAVARRVNCSLLAASVHPFADSRAQIVSSDPRYARIMAELQIVGRRFISQGLHVHVGIADGETAVRICDGIRFYLPFLLALTTSSPFYEGEDTGLHSYRTKLFEALPLAGLPDPLGSWQELCDLVSLLTRGGIIREVRDLWWDVRPHPDLGTVEVRICDLPSRLSEIIAIVALVQALVVFLARTPGTGVVDMRVLRANKWQAARYGLAGLFFDPVRERRLPLKDGVAETMDMVAPVAGELGSLGFFDTLSRILVHGTSADRQRALYRTTGGFVPMIRALQEELWR